MIENSNCYYSESNTTTTYNSVSLEEPFIKLEWPKENAHFLCKKCCTTPNIEFKKKNNIFEMSLPIK